MRFGLFFLPADRPGVDVDAARHYREMLDDIVLADALGFESAWFAEHHFSAYGGVMPSIAVFGAMVAACTEQIRIGTAATVLPLRDAVETAESFAMLDQLSDGRVDIGLGRGFLPREFDARSIPVDERGTRFSEGLDVLLGAWSDAPLTFHGTHYDYDGVDVTPKPLQQPHPPVWMAASTTQESFETAGGRGFDLMVNPYLRSDDELAAGVAWYRAARAAAGLDPTTARVMATLHMYCADDVEAARRDTRDAMVEYLAANKGAFDPAAVVTIDPATVDALWPDKVLFGDTAHIVERVDHWRSVGITDLACMTQFGGLAPGLVTASMRKFATEVIPKFQTSGDQP
jgi:natural product biosynthesis luciferase-like monooxygenase protein